MKSYGQLCAVARALDVVGDRWTLLIVRELLTRGEARFTELQRGLPGVAPNLLAQRLRALQEQGVLEQVPSSSAAAGGAYRLTDRGRSLEGVVRELMKWGAPTVPAAPRDAAFQMHWLSLPARYLLRDNRPDDDDVVLRFGDLHDGFDVTAVRGFVQVRPCAADAALAARVDGPGPLLVGLIQGAVPLARALEAGLTVEGDEAALQRVLPAA
ncbi:winged helix-turn-helix transcriptional regulator [Georgenia faecalis]|uniref:Winged helix-turn-helix transcriptional regulator n=1 Tax=Georgenia faecalis TaxID=2483799 RepID=A0ABV9DC43_9MICO|nr:helix-turn-helix domain-containing protein [Georgenia faecalis]